MSLSFIATTLVSPTFINTVLILHVVLAAWMTGIIWVVQCVHYPMFKALHTLPEADFQQWMRFHTKHITPIVGPAMLLEVITGLVLLYYPPVSFVPYWVWLINMLSIGLLFFATTISSIPAHGQLAALGFNKSVINRLVALNWVRTLLWTSRLAGLT
jgi:hypothetical protein